MSKRDLARRLLLEWRTVERSCADHPIGYWDHESYLYYRLTDYLDANGLAGTSLDPRRDEYLLNGG